MTFFYTCIYLPHQERSLRAVEFDNEKQFSLCLALWNSVAPKVYRYEAGPAIALTPQHHPTKVGDKSWLSHQAQCIFYAHRNVSNAEATLYLLKVIEEYNKAQEQTVSLQEDSHVIGIAQA